MATSQGREGTIRAGQESGRPASSRLEISGRQGGTEDSEEQCERSRKRVSGIEGLHESPALFIPKLALADNYYYLTRNRQRYQDTRLFSPPEDRHQHQHQPSTSSPSPSALPTTHRHPIRLQPAASSSHVSLTASHTLTPPPLNSYISHKRSTKPPRLRSFARVSGGPK